MRRRLDCGLHGIRVSRIQGFLFLAYTISRLDASRQSGPFVMLDASITVNPCGRRWRRRRISSASGFVHSHSLNLRDRPHSRGVHHCTKLHGTHTHISRRATVTHTHTLCLLPFVRVRADTRPLSTDARARAATSSRGLSLLSPPSLTSAEGFSLCGSPAHV